MGIETELKFREPNTQQETIFPVEPFNNDFVGKDIVSVEQFTNKQEVDSIFAFADQVKSDVISHKKRKDLEGYTVAELFYQASTRTFSSFLAAAQKLGADVIPIHGMTAYSSVAKGESLRDTIRTIEATTAADVIVLRHPEDYSSMEAANYASVPIINAGAGRIEHPTQGILDLYTIKQEMGRMNELRITMIGDLINGRTIKSLAKLEVLMGNNLTFNFIAPGVLQMPEEINSYLRSHGAKVNIGGNGDLADAIKETDVLYVTRIQSEWFTVKAKEDLIKLLGDKAKSIQAEVLSAFAQQLGAIEYQKAVEGYIIDTDLLDLASPNMIVMHPLPRVGEIDYKVDSDPRAAYFRQMRNGLYTRMAELALVTGKAEY